MSALASTGRANQSRGQRRALRLEPLEERCLLAGDAAEAINQFAFDLYEHMQAGEGNLFFSPLSISTAMGMAYAGAAGQTAAEMGQVLHFEGSEDIHAAFGELLASFAERTEPDPVDDSGWTPWPFPGPAPDWWPPRPVAASASYQMEVANAVFHGVDLRPSYIETMETDYLAHVEAISFGDPEAAEQQINAWASEQTRGRITELVDNLLPGTASLIANAVYFNATWDYPFDQARTSTGYFLAGSGDPVYPEVMHTVAETLSFRTHGFDVLSIPMAGGQASFVVIHNEEFGSDYDGELGELSADAFNAIASGLENDAGYLNDTTILSFPKVVLEVESELSEFLPALGMPRAFGASADFSELSTVPTYIRQVFHQSTLTVNEAGTSGSAASAVENYLCFAAGTMVRTPDGPRPIEDIRVGDVVLARDEHCLEGDVEPKVVEGALNGEAEIFELHLGERVIRTTDLHPFFVEGVGWTSAANLRVGDRLACDRGGSIAVTQVVATEKTEAVFNLRVADHRTYFVSGADWDFGVWVHNVYRSVDRAFHFMIRDNVTDTIAFMGRIDDPTLSENTVTPQVAQSNADWGDFDNSGVVDQADYVLWRSSYGQTGARLAADGNADGRVDSADYSVWRDNLGATSNPADQQDPVDPAEDPVVISAGRPAKQLARPVRPQQSLAPQAAEPDLLLLLAHSRTWPSKPLAPVTPTIAPSQSELETSRGEAFATLGQSVDDQALDSERLNKEAGRLR